MKAFYEQYREKENTFELLHSVTHEFPAHFHETVELAVIKKGGFYLDLNGKRYELSEGQVAIIDSYGIHGYKKKEVQDGDDYILMIPNKYLKNFRSITGGQKIKNPVITSTKLCDTLYEIIEKLLVQPKTERILSSALDLIFSFIEPHLEFTKDEKGEISLIRSVLEYVQINFQGDCSLSTIAKKFGYTPVHVSRVFHHYLNTGLPSYVNRLRLQYVDETLKANHDALVTKVLFDAGFSSIQTYYRVRANQK